jgi:hypothetical protein
MTPQSWWWVCHRCQTPNAAGVLTCRACGAGRLGSTTADGRPEVVALRVGDTEPATAPDMAAPAGDTDAASPGHADEPTASQPSWSHLAEPLSVDLARTEPQPQPAPLVVAPPSTPPPARSAPRHTTPQLTSARTRPATPATGTTSSSTEDLQRRLDDVNRRIAAAERFARTGRTSDALEARGEDPYSAKSSFVRGVEQGAGCGTLALLAACVVLLAVILP